MKVRRMPDGVHVVEGAPVPPGADGITLGSWIFLRKGHEESQYLLDHERVHVGQWRRLGLGGFGLGYLVTYAMWRIRGYGHQGSYRRIPLEIEADWRARRGD